MNIGVYVRVSTISQSTDLQLNEIKQYLSSKGVTEYSIYNDSGISGTTNKRPALQSLLKDVKDKKIGCVVVWKLDRLFRSLKDLINTLQDWEANGISFISVKDNIDLSTPIGRLIVHLLGSFSEFEAALIRERVKAGMQNAKREGKVLGRPREYTDEQLENASRATQYRRLQRRRISP